MHVTDQLLFERALKRFRAGQAKPFSQAFSNRAIFARFMHNLSRNPFERAVALEQYSPSASRYRSASSAFSVQLERIAAAQTEKDWDRVDELIAELLRIAEQVQCPNSPAAEHQHRWGAHELQSQYRLSLPTRFSLAQREAALRASIESRVRAEQLRQAEYELYANAFGRQVEGRWESFARDLPSSQAFFAIAFRPLPLLLAMVVASAIALSLWPGHGECEPAPVKGVSHIALLGCCVAVSACLFSFCPTEHISLEVQRWAFTSLVISSPLTLPLLAAWTWFVGQNRCLSMRSLLVLFTLSGVVMGLLSTAQSAGVFSFTDTPFDLYIPAIPWKHLNPPLLDFNFRADVPKQLAMQWDAYGGWFIATGAWLVIVAWVLQHRAQRTSSDRTPSIRLQWTAFLRSVRLPLWAYSLVLLTLFAAFAPARLTAMNEIYARRFRCAEESQKYGALVEKQHQLVQARGVGRLEAIWEFELKALRDESSKDRQIDADD